MLSQTANAIRFSAVTFEPEEIRTQNFGGRGKGGGGGGGGGGGEGGAHKVLNCVNF